MGLAEQIAEEIRQKREQADFAKNWQLTKSREIEKHTPIMWDDLVKAVKVEVGNFSKLDLSAKWLRADSQGPTHLLVQTDRFPVVKVNIFRAVDGYVTVDMMLIASGRGPIKQSEPQRFRFDVDNQLEPCFTDGEKQLHPQQLAEEILKPVFLFLADPSGDLTAR